MATRHRKTGDADPSPTTAMTTAELLDTSPFDGDLAAELAARPPRRVRPGVTMYLGVGVLVVAGFIGGVQVQKEWGAKPAATGTNALQQALANRFGGGAQGGNASGAPSGGQSGNVTFGTVRLVDGKTVYLQTTSGGVVQVKTNGSTKVRVSKDGTVKDLDPGSTVIVQGTPGRDGTVSATSVSEGSLPTGRGFGTRGGGRN